MDSYSFEGVIKDTVMGVEVEMPFSFHMVLSEEADTDLIPCAVNSIAFALATKLQRESDNDRYN